MTDRRDAARVCECSKFVNPRCWFHGWMVAWANRCFREGFVGRG